MKIYFKKYFSTSDILKIPSVPIKRGIMGKLTGNFMELYNLGKHKNQNMGMILYDKSREWYKEMDSKTFKFKVITGDYIFTSDPDFYKEILGQKQENFTNSIDAKTILGSFFKTSMIVVDGEQWIRIRKIAQKAINSKSLDDLVPIVCESTSKIFSNKNVNELETIDLISRVTFDSFHRLMYGWDPKSVLYSSESNYILQNCNVIARAIGTRSFLPIKWLWKIPTKENREIDKASLGIDKFVEDFVAKQKLILNENLKNPKYTKSLLDELIIASESPEEGGMTTKELYDQIKTLFFGAYDTTSNTLIFFLNYLARYPDTQAKLRSEIFSKFPKGIEDLQNAKIQDLENINYLTCYIEEVHRLNGLVPFFARDCIKDVQINNFLLKKGMRVLIDSRSVARDPDYFNGQTDLEEFRPERWNEFKPPTIKRAMPFGFGGRICIGRKIALAEMKIFLASILSQYEISLRNASEKIDLDFSIGLNLRPGNGNICFRKIPC